MENVLLNLDYTSIELNVRNKTYDNIVKILESNNVNTKDEVEIILNNYRTRTAIGKGTLPLGSTAGSFEEADRIISEILSKY